MSIIHDALKKAQQSTPATPTTPLPAAPAPAVPQPTTTGIIATCILACVALALAILLTLPIHVPLPPVKQTTSLAPAPPPAKEIPAAAPAAATPEPVPIKDDPVDRIRVEGIMDMGGKKAALINGSIYEEGQTINGKVIAEITFNTLTIIDNGNKRIIPVTP